MTVEIAFPSRLNRTKISICVAEKCLNKNHTSAGSKLIYLSLQSNLTSHGGHKR